MGATREQRLGGIKNDVAWLTIPERLSVLWALLSRRADEYELPNGKWKKSGLLRPIPFTEKMAAIAQRKNS